MKKELNKLSIPVNRDAANAAHVVALSGGKDSTAMAFKLREIKPGVPFTFICTPTGNESPDMFAHWRKLSDKLQQRIYPIFGGSLKSVIAEERAIPNFRMRFCTRRLKIEPYIAFCQRIMPAVSYVGLRADEGDREGITDHGGDLSIPKPFGIEQRYPLRELGWGISEVMAYLNSLDIAIPERTDCEWCFWQRLGEWYLLWRDRRDSYLEAAALEVEWGHTWRSAGRGTWPASLGELAGEFARGRIPEVSLRMMEKRKGMCRVCSL